MGGDFGSLSKSGFTERQKDVPGISEEVTFSCISNSETLYLV